MILRAFFTSLLLFALSGCASGSKSPLLAGAVAPYTRVTLLDGGDYVPLNELRADEGMVVLFWASWCSSSRSTIADLNEFALEARSAGLKIKFVAVSIDKLKDEKKLRAFLKEEKLVSFLHAFSGNDASDEAFLAFEVDEVPTIFLLNSRGVVLYNGSSVDELEEVLLSRAVL